MVGKEGKIVDGGKKPFPLLFAGAHLMFDRKVSSLHPPKWYRRVAFPSNEREMIFARYHSDFSSEDCSSHRAYINEPAFGAI